MEDPIAASPIFRNLAARVLAQDEVIETLLVTMFLQQGSAFESAFIAQLQKRTWAQTPQLGDEAAEFWADVSVLSQGSLDLLLERAQRGAREARGPAPSGSS